jgi:formylglycine-generating enzyme required for sulfatase activity
MHRTRLALLTSLLAFTLGCPGGEGDDEASETGESESGTSMGMNETGSETGETGDADLIEIPGGSFEMGCPADAAECDADNQPPHAVTVSPYAIEKTEVTVAAYTECVEAGGCSEATSGAPCSYGDAQAGLHPINCVTWQQAVDYCAWKGRRLPSEAEWEFAARSNTGRLFPWGSAEASCTFAHMYQMLTETSTFGCDSNDTARVGSYPTGTSPFGLFDMAGNVEEWTADWYGETYYAESPGEDPSGPSEGTLRVVRGGDWYDASPNNLRTIERARAMPSIGAAERGFRCAADL